MYKFMAALIPFVVRLLLFVALCVVSYYRQKNHTTKELAKSCLPDKAARKDFPSLMFWLVTLMVYHLPTLACHILCVIFRVTSEKCENVIDGPNPRIGMPADSE